MDDVRKGRGRDPSSNGRNPATCRVSRPGARTHGPAGTSGCASSSRRGDLFEAGHERKRFAVVTNRSEEGSKVFEWHREKAGTVEHVHDEMKNEPAAGRMPGRKSGANASWFALDAPACNVAAALRAAEPEPEARMARARAVRCHLLLPGARLSRFSHRITLRFAASKERIARVLRVLTAFPCRVQPTGQAVPGANRGERRRTGSARRRRSVPGSGPPATSGALRTPSGPRSASPQAP